MRKIILSLFCGVFITGFNQTANAGSPVWKIEKGGSKIFIGGTIHVLGQSDYPLPSAFDQAYRRSEILVFETDINEMKTPVFQKKMLSQVSYGATQSLQTVLEPETFALLESHLKERGLPLAQFILFKPGMIAATLTVLELRRLGLAGTGADDFFYTKAMRDRKRVVGLETANQQLNFIATMGLGQENEMIRYTLRDLKQLPAIMDNIKTQWREGDMAAMDKEFLEPFKKDFSKTYQQLIVQRNKNWIPAIKAMLDTKETEFVLVGALHLPGEEGILTILESLGYRIEML